MAGGDFHHHGADARVGRPVTWIAAEDRSAEAVLEAISLGRTAVAVDPASAALLPVDGEIVAMRADGLVFIDGEGGRRVVHGDRVTLTPSGIGPWRLETPRRETIAATA